MENLKKKAILCPNCGKLIGRSESRCPYCDIPNPDSWWKSGLPARAFLSGGQLIRLIIYANVGMFILSLLLNSRAPGFSANPFHVLSPENSSLFFLGATGSAPIERYHRYWTLISASYLHGGLLHLLFNMIALRQVAGLVIEEFGRFRMFTIFTVGGAIGFWISYRAGIIFTIGASASICALIGSIIYYGISRGGVYGKMIYTQIGGWALGIFVFGLLIPGINNWGHGGGFLAGMALGFFLGYQDKARETRFHRILGTGLFALTAVVLAWAITAGIYLRLAA